MRRTSEIITAPTTTEIPVPAAPSTLSSALPPPPPQASASGTGASTNWSGTAGTTGNPLPPPEQTTAKSTSSRTRHRKPTSDATTYSGRADPPTTQENATPTGASSANPAPPATRTPVFIPNPEPVVPASQQPSPRNGRRLRSPRSCPRPREPSRHCASHRSPWTRKRLRFRPGLPTRPRAAHPGIRRQHSFFAQCCRDSALNPGANSYRV